MKFIPILFSTAMIAALTSGRKTMTRRSIKWPKTPDWHDWEWDPNIVVKPNGGEWWPHYQHKSGHKDVTGPIGCPYGGPGDILWVRESWQWVDGILGSGCYFHKASSCEEDKTSIKWRPSIHMPKEACRLFLQITDVRVERLKDITPNDACEEGVEYWNVDMELCEQGELQADYMNYTWTSKRENDENYEDRYFPTFANPIDSFRTLWQSINGEESWSENPWVWVISFKVIDKPENFLQ